MFLQMIKEKQSSINLLIVDEVHTIYLWGLSEKNEEKAFRADFGKLDNVIGRLRVSNGQGGQRWLPATPVLAATAT